MKKRAAASVFLAFVAAAAASQTPLLGEKAHDAYAERLAEISAFGQRAENGDAERKVIAYIEAALGSAGIATQVRDFSGARDGYSASRIVEALIPGALPEELTLVAPLDSWYDSRSGGEGAAGLAFALSEAERIAASGREPALSLRFVFLGAERRGRSGEGEEASLGSRFWIDGAPTAVRRAVLYLNLDEGFSSLALRNAGEGRSAPFWHFERTRAALEDAGLRPGLDANRLLIYRLGLADRYGPEAPYLAAGIPALELRGPGSGEGPRADGAAHTGEKLSTFFDTLIAANAEGLPEDWDLHYLAFELGGRSWTLRETAYIRFLIAFFAILSLAVLAYTIVRRSDAKPVISRLPLMLGQTAALFASLAVVFLAGDAMSRLDALALGSSEAWLLAPRVFAAARLASSLFLFLALISLLVTNRVLTANPYFYEFCALLCLGFDVLVFSAVDPSVSFPFVWAFLVVAASLATRRGWATIAAYGLMYLPLLLLAVELALLPERAVLSRLLSPGLAGSLALAALLLPFYAFTASPLLFFAPRGALARRKAAILLAGLALASEGAALAIAARSGKPGLGSRFATEVGPRISESLDQDSGLFVARLEDRKRLGKGKLYRGPQELSYESTGDVASMEGADTRRQISFRLSRSYFLDRRTELVAISFARAPFALRISLGGSEELRIYDCGLPYRVALDGRSAEVFAAVNPGQELSFALTLPRGLAADLSVRAEYLDPLLPFTFPDGDTPRPGIFSVSATTHLAPGE